MILRLIIAALLIYLVVRLLRRLRQTPRSKTLWRSTVKCNHCGIHIDQDEALHKNDNWYCCEEHQRIDQ